ncbi:complement C1q-like protein 3 [Triplophysa rosa]|uniref:complement C1q-like protein 3 n=1 Tax=Triplophysa rosa TaxID=992332 RepID=UPI002545D271|nr:complement C1q-like protein 3 [Triplophysa rosa]
MSLVGIFKRLSQRKKAEVRMKIERILYEAEFDSVSQDLLTPTVNIIAELEKLKNMEAKIQNLEETLNKVLSENEALKGLVQDSQNKLESFQKEKEAQKIAFSAGLLASGSGHTGPVDYRKTLEYKKVFSNIGNAYDPDTGVFTAPVKGVYYFRFYAHSHAGIKMAVSLLKNGQIQGSVFSWMPVTNGNASNGVVLTLEPGDRVYTQLWENTWVYDDEASYTSFSGFMIFPL